MSWLIITTCILAAICLICLLWGILLLYVLHGGLREVIERVDALHVRVGLLSDKFTLLNKDLRES